MYHVTASVSGKAPPIKTFVVLDSAIEFARKCAGQGWQVVAVVDHDGYDTHIRGFGLSGIFRWALPCKSCDEEGCERCQEWGAVVDNTKQV